MAEPSPWEARKRVRQQRELRRLLALTYKPKGVEIWLAHAEKAGWSYAEQLNRARAMAEGTFA